MSGPNAIVVGEARPFGAEIVAALRVNGYMVATFADTSRVGAEESGVTDVEVLVINAPVTEANRSFDSITDAEFDGALTEHLYDIVAVAQHVLPKMLRGGRIVNVGSRGHLGAWGGAHLMAASAAMAGMTRCMALELAADGISVNNVAAGFAGTSWDTPENRRNVANTVCHLAAPNTGLVGETLIVDGGRSLRMSESRRR